MYGTGFLYRESVFGKMLSDKILYYQLICVSMLQRSPHDEYEGTYLLVVPL